MANSFGGSLVALLRCRTWGRHAGLRPNPARSFHLQQTVRSYRNHKSTSVNDHRPLDDRSWVVGPSSPALDERTLGRFWDAQVDAHGGSMALISRHENMDQHHPSSRSGEAAILRWTYKEMGNNVDALARGLLKMGIRKGDRVGAYLGNCSLYALLSWATAKIGAILVCINPASRGPQLLTALNLTSSKALFIPPTLRTNDHTAMLHSLLPTLRNSTTHGAGDPACPSLSTILVVDNTRLGAAGFEDFLEDRGLAGRDARQAFDWDGSGVPGAEDVDRHDVCALQFTSGTTGNPKAVSLTHTNLLNNGKFIGHCMKLRPPDPAVGWNGERLCNSPPLFHCFGAVLGNLALWTHGGTIVYASESFDAVKTLQAVVLEKCTALHGVPTMFNAELALLDHLDTGKHVPGLSELGHLDFSSLRTGIAAGSPVPDETMRRLIKRMNLSELTITYGQTETSPATIMSTTDDPIDLRCKTVGRVMPHARIRIVDPHHDLYPSPETPPVPVGTPGEIWSAGYSVFKGYWENDAETQKSVFEQDGVRWMRTGDQGIMNEDGYISIVGRIKDIIIRGGENLFPVVIENKAMLLPGVADCSVVAVSDPVMGEVVGAFLKRDDSPAGQSLTRKELCVHIDTLISHQASPDWVWFMGEDGVADDWPKTASGKIRKVELRDWANELAKRGVGGMRPKALEPEQ